MRPSIQELYEVCPVELSKMPFKEALELKLSQAKKIKRRLVNESSECVAYECLSILCFRIMYYDGTILDITKDLEEIGCT